MLILIFALEKSQEIGPRSTLQAWWQKMSRETTQTAPDYTNFLLPGWLKGYCSTWNRKFIYVLFPTLIKENRNSRPQSHIHNVCSPIPTDVMQISYLCPWVRGQSTHSLPISNHCQKCLTRQLKKNAESWPEMMPSHYLTLKKDGETRHKCTKKNAKADFREEIYE